MGDVVVDAHREAAPRRRGLELVEDRLGHGRGELLGGEPVAATDDLGQGIDAAVAQCVHQRRDDIQQKGFTGGAGLLGAVEYRNRANGRGQRLGEALHREGAVQPHLHESHLFSGGHEVLHGLMSTLRTRAHHHHDPLRLGMADVVERRIGAAGQLGETSHRVGDDVGTRIVERVGRLTTLKEGVGVLRRSPHDGVFGGEGPIAVCGDGPGIEQRVQRGVIDRRQLLNLV